MQKWGLFFLFFLGRDRWNIYREERRRFIAARRFQYGIGKERRSEMAFVRWKRPTDRPTEKLFVLTKLTTSNSADRKFHACTFIPFRIEGNSIRISILFS